MDIQRVHIKKLVRPLEQYNGWGLNTRPPEIGDAGFIVDILTIPGLPDNYVVEASRPDGSTLWLGEFSRDELEEVDHFLVTVPVETTSRNRTEADEDGNLLVHSYNDREQRIRTVTYDGYGRVECDIRYDFDAEGRVSEERVYNCRGLSRRVEFVYGPDGVREIRQYRGDGTLTIITVESVGPDGRLVRRHYDADRQPITAFANLC